MYDNSDHHQASAAPRYRRMLKSKIHRITVTDANLHYPGSLTLDTELMKAADLLENEQIDVVNVNNGARFSTYVIPGERGDCCLNGAAARLGAPGDLLIIMAFDLIDDVAAREWRPTVIHVDADNKPLVIDDDSGTLHVVAQTGSQ